MEMALEAANRSPFAPPPPGPRSGRHASRASGAEVTPLPVRRRSRGKLDPTRRDVWAGTEVPLATYAQWQTPRARMVDVFHKVLGGISSREYEGAAEAVPEAFWLAKSRVSRRLIRASATARQTLQERRQDDAEWLVLVLDGTSLAADQVVIALGVTTTGETRLLGLVQTATENTRVWAAFWRELVERGFTAPAGLLVVLDGAKGRRAAVRDVFGDDVPVQRDRRSVSVFALIRGKAVVLAAEQTA